MVVGGSGDETRNDNWAGWKIRRVNLDDWMVGPGGSVTGWWVLVGRYLDGGPWWVGHWMI